MRSEREMIRRMLSAQRIAVVGLSDDPSRPSFGVAAALCSAGKTIVPVNPKCQSIMGLRCYASLTEASGLFDIVDIFRRPEFCPDIVREAIRIARPACGFRAESSAPNRSVWPKRRGSISFRIGASR